jgi:hypothetical protein
MAAIEDDSMAPPAPERPPQALLEVPCPVGREYLPVLDALLATLVVLATVQVMLAVNPDVDPFTPRTFPVLGVYVLLAPRGTPRISIATHGRLATSMRRWLWPAETHDATAYRGPCQLNQSHLSRCPN